MNLYNNRYFIYCALVVVHGDSCIQLENITTVQGMNATTWTCTLCAGNKATTIFDRKTEIWEEVPGAVP